MQFYGISITPILKVLKQKVTAVSQVADDATGAGKIADLLKWWKLVIEEGAKIGYYVKPSKSWLVLKNPNMIRETQTLFQRKKTPRGRIGIRRTQTLVYK